MTHALDATTLNSEIPRILKCTSQDHSIEQGGSMHTDLPLESLIEKDGSEISAILQHQQTKTLSNNNDAYTKFDQIHGAYLFCSLCIKARCLLKK